jgi:predicted DNA binding CopG/RHH family protein
MTNNQPKTGKFYDAEDKALYEAIEGDEYDWDNPLGSEAVERLKILAKNTANPPRKQITTRVHGRDLSKLRSIAMQKGIPYQTLLASIIHQYVEGRLTEK